MILIKSVAFAVFEILQNLVSLQNFLNANNCWRNENLENFPTCLYLYLWCAFRIITWFCFIFSFIGCRNVASFTKRHFYRKQGSVTMLTMRKRFRLIMAPIWFKSFWQNICPVENRNLWPASLHQSAITQKREVPQLHVLMFFLISSIFSISSTAPNTMIRKSF